MTSLEELPKDKRPRIVVLISGSGSNLQALIDANPAFNIVHVFSSRSSAYGLQRCLIHSIPSTTLALKPFLTSNPGKTRVDYDKLLAEKVIEQKPDLVVLAGWMLVLSDTFLNLLVKPSITENEQEQGQAIPIINLHPALPNTFDGANAIARAHEAFIAGKISKTGVMIHKVIPAVDKGDPILVQEVECKEGESVQALEERIHMVEHDLIVRATKMLTQAMV